MWHLFGCVDVGHIQNVDNSWLCFFRSPLCDMKNEYTVYDIVHVKFMYY